LAAVAEVSCHFKDQRRYLARWVAGAVLEELLGVRTHAGRGFASPDRPDDGHARVEAALGDHERGAGALRGGAVVLLKLSAVDVFSPDTAGMGSASSLIRVKRAVSAASDDCGMSERVCGSNESGVKSKPARPTACGPLLCGPRTSMKEWTLYEVSDQRVGMSMAYGLLSSWRRSLDHHNRRRGLDPLRELLATDHRQALEFFFLGLQDVSEPSVDRQELLYNASVLAHYAQVSTQAAVDWPAPANLSVVFDHFVTHTTVRYDGVMMETAGAQCLLLAGFFEDQMRRRHNIRWYAQLGASFFNQAAVQEQSLPKAQLLHTIARRFEAWRQRHARLSRELRDQAYMLIPREPPPPMSQCAVMPRRARSAS
jgi:hypothetical protein